jgi:ATP-dependent DNA helicase PIF1
MMNNIIEATILNGKFKGEDVLFPRIPMIPTSDRYVVRVQAFAVSCATRFCNDHQQSTRTSLKVCGLNLENPCFSNEKLYVASDLFVYTPQKKTKNIVYSKALQ